jgi:hypothetical protein
MLKLRHQAASGRYEEEQLADYWDGNEKKRGRCHDLLV